MRRVEIVVHSNPRDGDAESRRRVVLGRFGSAVATLIAGAAAVAIVGAVLALGYVVMGFAIAALFLAVLAAVSAGIWRRLQG